jgi:hypothetical protein
VKKKKMTTLSNTGDWRVVVVVCKEKQPKEKIGQFHYYGDALKLKADMEAEQFLEIGEKESAEKFKLLNFYIWHSRKTVTIEIKKI